MRTYVLVEGHGETTAVLNLLSRLAQECAPGLLPFAEPIRVPGIAGPATLLKYSELVRQKRDARAFIAIRDDEDGCPKVDAPEIARALRGAAFPFPAAIVLAFREYESLFLPCIQQLAGRPIAGPGGERPGLRPDARHDGDFESRRSVKDWLTAQMPPGRAYKPSVDQLPFTRMVDFAVVRERGLPWFGSLERSLMFLAAHLGRSGDVYPPLAT